MASPSGSDTDFNPIIQIKFISRSSFVNLVVTESNGWAILALGGLVPVVAVTVITVVATEFDHCYLSQYHGYCRCHFALDSTLIDKMPPHRLSFEGEKPYPHKAIH